MVASARHRDAPAARPQPRPGGLLLLLGGAVLCGIAFAAGPWYAVDAGADSAGSSLLFSDLHANADRLAAPVAQAYFDRLAWGLVGIVVLLGVLAGVARRTSTPVRALGFFVAVAGIVLTYYALAQEFNAQQVAGATSHGVLHSASWGLYLAFAGYVVLAAGTLLAVRPAASATRPF